jgi:hypothetical protein
MLLTRTPEKGFARTYRPPPSTDADAVFGERCANSASKDAWFSGSCIGLCGPRLKPLDEAGGTVSRHV